MSTGGYLVTRGNYPSVLFEDDRDAYDYVAWMRSKTTDIFTVSTHKHGPSDLETLDTECTTLTDRAEEAEKDLKDWTATAKEFEERAKMAEESAETLRVTVGALRDKIENVRAVIGED